MSKRARFVLIASDGSRAARGQLLELQGGPWNIIGWDDRACFMLIEREGAVCQIPRQMCFDLGYRWRPLDTPRPAFKRRPKPRITK